MVKATNFAALLLAGLAAAVAGGFTQVASPEAVPRDRTWQVILVDLQAIAGEPAEILARLPAAPAGSAPPRIIAFGPHVAKERLDRARQAGAHLVVSRGELLGDFAAVLARVLPHNQSGDTHAKKLNHFPSTTSPFPCCLSSASTSWCARFAIVSSYPFTATALNARFHGLRLRRCSSTS